VVFWSCSDEPEGGYAHLDSESVPAQAWASVWPESELVQSDHGPLDASIAQAFPPVCGVDDAPDDLPAAEFRMADLLRLGGGSGGGAGILYGIYDLHVDHLGSVRLVTNDSGEVVSRHDYFPFGKEVAPSFDYNAKKFTGHERDEATGLDYMFARYYGSSPGRFLSVDPSRRSVEPLDPQSWNRYPYAANNPINLVDPDGETPIRYFIRAAGGAYRAVKRSVAVRKALSSSHAVKVTGPGASKKARGIVKDAHPNRGTKRHDHGDPHWQPRKSVTRDGKNVGQVHYSAEGIVAAAAGLGAAAQSSVEAATGSETVGTIVEVAIDFVNPATDIQEGAALVEEIGTDIVEAVYDVELGEDGEEAVEKENRKKRKAEESDDKNKSSAPSGSTEGICIGSTFC
jgi:RHS repeat-associated protein